MNISVGKITLLAYKGSLMIKIGKYKTPPQSQTCFYYQLT